MAINFRWLTLSHASQYNECQHQTIQNNCDDDNNIKWMITQRLRKFTDIFPIKFKYFFVLESMNHYVQVAYNGIWFNFIYFLELWFFQILF